MTTEESFDPHSAPALDHNSSEPFSLPPYPQMIMEAMEALNDKNGSNKTAISKHIESLHPNLPPSHTTLLSYHLNQLKQNGQLVMVKNNYMKPDPAAPPKRGRGRPPKPKPPVDSIDAPAAAAATPRPRGRPPKSKDPSEQATQPKPKPNSGSGRPRGRPPKKPRTYSETSSAPEAEPVKAQAVSASTQPNGERRGRGRPPKVKPVVAPVGC